MAQVRPALGVVHGHVQGQGALAHRRAGGQYHQVRALDSAQQLVQVGESRHQRGVRDRQQVRRRGLVLQVAVEYVAEGLEVPLLGGVPDPVDRVLGLPERDLQVVGVGVAQLGDPGTRRYELSHRGGAGHDLGVVLGMDGRGCDGHQVGQVGHASGQLQPLGPGQLTG